MLGWFKGNRVQQEPRRETPEDTGEEPWEWESRRSFTKAVSGADIGGFNESAQKSQTPNHPTLARLSKVG